MKTIDIIIETPKGYSGKYQLDDHTGYFKLSKVLPAGMAFPFDFGFIPHTKGEDKDPLDAVIISEFQSFPGAVVECRLIGAMLAEQKENGEVIRNDRYLFVPVLSRQFKKINKIKDIPKSEWKDLEAFFIQYNKAEDKEFRIVDLVTAKEAMNTIKQRL